MKNKKLTIRILKPSECNSLIDIWIKASLPIKPEGRDLEDNIKRQIQLDNNRFFVVEIDDKLVGAIIASHNGRKGWINRLAVLPEFSGRGIATALINKAEDFFLSNNIKIFACLIEDWNDVSMKFFQDRNYIGHKDIIYLTKKTDPNI